MIDIKLIRDNPKHVAAKIKDRGFDADLDKILKLDGQVKELNISVQKLREERNKISKEKDIEKGKKIKKELGEKEKKLEATNKDLQELLLQIPNIALPQVPVGNESKNEIIKKVGEPKKFDFTPKDHLEIGEKLGIIDVQRAVKVSGTRFAYLKGDGALLEFAIVQYVLEKLTKEGFIPIIPPTLKKQNITEGLGYWTEGNQNNYYSISDYEEKGKGEGRENPLYLVGTGEHSVVSMHKDEVFNIKELPKRYLAFSPCFRREAGSYGKDTKGIFRVHQFDKLEMVSFVKPQDDKKEREKLLSLTEGLVSDLGFSYRAVRLATEDMAFPAAETIDIETWIPSQERFRETHSISTTTDFQARRLNIRYQDGPPALRSEHSGSKTGGERKYVHILNGTAFAIGRTLMAILENYQQEDGSVLVPKVLQKYLNKTVIKPQK